jgi:hypothetical protein
MGIRLLFTKANIIISHVVWIMLTNLPIEMCIHKFFKVYLDYNLQITSVSDYNLHDHPKRKRKKKPNTNGKKWSKQIKLSGCGKQKNFKTKEQDMKFNWSKRSSWYILSDDTWPKFNNNFFIEKSIIHHQESLADITLIEHTKNQI